VYYFKGQDLCADVRHYRDDMRRLRDAGVDAVIIAIHEADLEGGNLGRVCEESLAAGLRVWGVPSRVGALVAGWSRAVGYLAALHPELWARRPDGSPVTFYGPMVSVHHPEALPGFVAVVESMLERFPLSGLIWDELKSLDIQDHSPAAIQALGRPARGQDQIDATTRFFGQVNARLKAKRPDLPIALFIYCDMPQPIVEACAAIGGLDEFGCDGRCLRADDPPDGEGGANKILLPNLSRFIQAARRNGRRSFTLIETQCLPRLSLETTLARVPELCAQPLDHIVYYDYAPGSADADQIMPRLSEALAPWRRT